MKTIGLLGGMSWESTTTYYQIINQEISKRLGGLNSAKIILHSVNFEEIEQLQHNDQWNETALILGEGAKSVEAGGADFLLICTNTMHKVFKEIEEAISIPLIHIGDTTAKTLLVDKIKKPGLLGTKFTMEQDFYTRRLQDKFGLDIIIPERQEREDVHNIIYQELCQGKIKDDSRKRYNEIINNMVQQGSDAIILGCTEIALLVHQSDVQIPLYDTARIHATAAVDLALS